MSSVGGWGWGFDLPFMDLPTSICNAPAKQVKRSQVVIFGDSIIRHWVVTRLQTTYYVLKKSFNLKMWVKTSHSVFWERVKTFFRVPWSAILYITINNNCRVYVNWQNRWGKAAIYSQIKLDIENKKSKSKKQTNKQAKKRPEAS